jgi:hypothetical protein
VGVVIYRDQLEAVYRLIEKPENWTQEYDARDSLGEEVMFGSSAACCWCLSGAFAKAGLGHSTEIGRTLMPDSEDEYAFVQFNDTHTHAEVLALLASAIERAPVREVAP